MLDFKSVRPLDAVIAGVAAVVLLLGAFLGYSVWSQNRNVVQSTPASREIDSLIAKVKNDPNNIETRMELAQTFAVAGRDKDAIKQYKAVLTVAKDYPPALSGLGFLALQKKQYTTGERYFRRIIDLEAGKANESQNTGLEVAYFYLGSALLEQKEYEEAASNFKAALRIRRDASDTHYALAVCLREIGSKDAYRESLENALAFDPKMPEANYDLGMLLLADKDAAGAAEHFRTSLDAAPFAEKPKKALAKLGDADDHLAKAKQLSATDVKKALAEARVAAALEPRSTEALVVLGDTWVKMKNPEKAAEAYRKVLVVDPENKAAKAGLERTANGD